MTDAPRPHAGDAGEETVMNMTPMIDIVFQLIIFFLLSLKFKTIDERLDAKLPPVGLWHGPPSAEPGPRIKLKLFRRDLGTPSAYTLVKVDNSHHVALPSGRWPLDAEGQAAHRRAYDTARAELLAIIASKWAAVGGDPELHGEIATPRPHGGAVPHGDSIFALDTLVEAGINDVRFEGAPGPLPR